MLNWPLFRTRGVVLSISIGTSLWFLTPSFKRNSLQRSSFPVESSSQHSQWLRFWNNGSDHVGTPTNETSGVMMMSSNEEGGGSKASPKPSQSKKSTESSPQQQQQQQPQRQQQPPSELDFKDMSYGDPNPNCALKSDLREGEEISFEDEHPDLDQCAFCILFDKHTPCGHLFSAFKECSLQKIRRKRQAQAETEGLVQSANEKPVVPSQSGPSENRETEAEEKHDEEEFDEEELSKPDECMLPFITFRKCMFHFPHYYSQRNKWLSGLYDAMERDSNEADQEDQDEDTATEKSKPSHE